MFDHDALVEGARLLEAAEAELAERAEGRVVTVLAHEFLGIAPSGHWESQSRRVADGPCRVAIRRLPDEPEPVEVWERPCGGQICSACGFPATTRELGKPCPNANCGKLLASTASPWRGGE